MIERALPIRVVVFTGGPTLQAQFTKFLELLESDPEIELVAVFSQSPNRGLVGIVRDLWSRRGMLAVPLLLKMLLSALWRQISSLGVSRVRRRLLRDLKPILHFVSDIHDAVVIQRVRDLEPALGLVYGGPIVKPELFDIPKHGTLGIHHGKVPEYRGKKTTFWAVLNGESEVGVTIQRIGSRLDGGEVLREGRVSVGKQPLAWIKRRLEQQGLDLYIEAIHAVRDGSAVFHTQPHHSGTLYRDPGITDIIIFWFRYLLRLAGIYR